MKTNNESKSVSLSTVPVVFITVVLTFAILAMGEIWLRALGLGTYSSVIPPLVVSAGILFAIKRSILAFMSPSYELKPMTALEFAGAQNYSIRPNEPIPAPDSRSKVSRQLDVPRLERLTAELQSLGFRMEREGQLVPSKANKQVIYARIFEHPSGAGATVMQIFAAQAVFPVVLAIDIAFEDGWNWVESNHKQNWLHFMMRRPRALGKVHPGESGALELWTSCQEKSARIERELGVGRCPVLARNYEIYMAQSIAKSKEAFCRKNIVVGILEGIFIMPKTTEWWGEYAKYANKANS